VAADLTQARELVGAYPALRVVTRQGDVLGAHWASGGSARPASEFTLRSVADEAAAGLEAVDERCEQAAEQLALAVEAEDQARQAVAKAQAALRDVDAAAAEVSGRLGRLSGAARAARDEAQRLEAAIDQAHRAHEASQASVAELEASLAEAEDGPHADGQPQAQQVPGGTEDGSPQDEAGPAPDREALAGQVTAGRNAEMEERLEVRTAEERLRAIAGRADALVASAAAERQAAQRAAARRIQRERQAVVARAVADGAAYALARLAGSLAAASEQRQMAEQASKGRAVALKEVRVQVRDLAAEFDRVVDAAHGTEMARTEHRMRLEQLAARAAEEFAVSAEELVAEYGPTVPVPVISPDSPPSPASAAESPAGADPAGQAGGLPDDPLDAQEAAEGASNGSLLVPPPAPPSEEQQVLTGTIPYVRAEQERRAAAAQRQLDQLGKVNPLALEEFAALEERHAFLATQLEDLKNTRRDLLTVVKEVDDRVQEVFASAFEDTAREFEEIFSRLFPGGEGRLILTEPDDMLATGIDFEARPPGKKVKRMSLLSGGERSLTAIAFLLAIFKARPSPFYVLDEVEAALDDTNMQRLLHIFEELRSVSQLLIITHQKRTMEIADALYGISMRGDGVSAVVSQRLRERESA
jgi:chromosome segregation protein